MLCHAERVLYDALHRTPDIHDERNYELRYAAASCAPVTGNPVTGRLPGGEDGGSGVRSSALSARETE